MSKKSISIQYLMDSLLSDIYGKESIRNYCESIDDDTNRSSDENHKENQFNNNRKKDNVTKWIYSPKILHKQSAEYLTQILASLKLEIRITGMYLGKLLILKDRLIRRKEIFCTLITSQLMEINIKLGEPPDEICFRLTPPSPVENETATAIMGISNTSSDFNQWLHAMKMVARLPGGMPPEFRRKLWLALADKHLQTKGIDWNKEQIKCLSDQWRDDDEELGIQIVKDLHRTGSSLFSGPTGSLNQAKLKRVLLGYARWNPEVGYCQGFNMLGALILQVMDKNENESLRLMIFLVEGILPAGYFCGSLGGLQADMAVFRDLLSARLPKLARHLERLQGSICEDTRSFEPPLTNVFTMQWFLTLFCTCLPINCVLRVWDLVLIEGSDILLRCALAIWGLLEERILTIKSADDFYCKMGTLSGELLNGHLFDSNGLIQKIVDLGPIKELQKMRDKHLYNIAPWRDKKGLRLFYSDDEGEFIDDDSGLAMTTAASWGIRLGSSVRRNSKEKIALDMSMLKKQYEKVKERHRQAHIIVTSGKNNLITNTQPSTSSSSSSSAVPINQLLLGKNAIVSNRGRRCGPIQGSIPPARKILPNTKILKQHQRYTGGGGSSNTNNNHNSTMNSVNISKKKSDTLYWKDTDVKCSKIEVDTTKSANSTISSCTDYQPTPLNRSPSVTSSLSSSVSDKSERITSKSHRKSESSSYSEDDDDDDSEDAGHSSTSTSLCDDLDLDYFTSSVEASPLKRSNNNNNNNNNSIDDQLIDVTNNLITLENNELDKKYTESYQIAIDMEENVNFMTKLINESDNLSDLSTIKEIESNVDVIETLNKQPTEEDDVQTKSNSADSKVANETSVKNSVEFLMDKTMDDTNGKIVKEISVDSDLYCSNLEDSEDNFVKRQEINDKFKNKPNEIDTKILPVIPTPTIQSIAEPPDNPIINHDFVSDLLVNFLSTNSHSNILENLDTTSVANQSDNDKASDDAACKLDNDIINKNLDTINLDKSLKLFTYDVSSPVPVVDDTAETSSSSLSSTITVITTTSNIFYGDTNSIITTTTTTTTSNNTNCLIPYDNVSPVNITSTSQLSPIADLYTYLSTSNISPLKTPVTFQPNSNVMSLSTNDIIDIDPPENLLINTNLSISLPASPLSTIPKQFDYTVNDEGVTNEYFERIISVPPMTTTTVSITSPTPSMPERPNKLELNNLYFLDNINLSTKFFENLSSCDISGGGVGDGGGDTNPVNPDVDDYITNNSMLSTILNNNYLTNDESTIDFQINKHFNYPKEHSNSFDDEPEKYQKTFRTISSCPDDVQNSPTTIESIDFPNKLKTNESDKILKIIEENSKILNRILSKSISENNDQKNNEFNLIENFNNYQSADSETTKLEYSQKNTVENFIRRFDDENISETITSIKNTIKSIDSLCQCDDGGSIARKKREKTFNYIEQIDKDKLNAMKSLKMYSPLLNQDQPVSMAQPPLTSGTTICDVSPTIPTTIHKSTTDTDNRKSVINSIDLLSLDNDRYSESPLKYTSIRLSELKLDSNNSSIKDISIDNSLLKTKNDDPLKQYIKIDTNDEIRSIDDGILSENTIVITKTIDTIINPLSSAASDTNPILTSPIITRQYLDSLRPPSEFTRNSKSAENSPSRNKYDSGTIIKTISPTMSYELFDTDRRKIITDSRDQIDISNRIGSTNYYNPLKYSLNDIHIRSYDNISTEKIQKINYSNLKNYSSFTPSTVTLPLKIKKPSELGIKLGMYKNNEKSERS